MAERDRYDWDRSRDYGDRDREYGRGGDRERGYQDRSVMSRGADEVRSWFGDDEARRRREIDEQRDRELNQRERDYGPNSEQARREHGWRNQAQRPDSQWEGGRSSQTAWGDQRDFVGRSNDWSGSQYSPRGREWDDPGFSGGYGAGRYESGRYGRDYNTTGEGRWGQQSGSSFGGWSYGRGMFAGRGPRNYQRSDERIREDVNERLTADPRIDAWEIEVRVQNGEVILSGTVDDRRTRRMAEECIEDLPGVRDVRNELRVRETRWGNEQHRFVGEQSRGREDGSIGNTGDPQRRDDVTTVNVKDTGRK